MACKTLEAAWRATASLGDATSNSGKCCASASAKTALCGCSSAMIMALDRSQSPFLSPTSDMVFTVSWSPRCLVD